MRKIIQIAVTSDADGDQFLYALTDDGCVFTMLNRGDWKLVQSIPHDDEDE